MKVALAFAAAGVALTASPATAGGGDGMVFDDFLACEQALARADPKNKNWACVWDPDVGGYVTEIRPEPKKKAARR